MKKLAKPVKVIEVENEGAISLLGDYVEIRCGNYHYAGKLVGVNDLCVELEEAHTIFDGGSYTTKKYSDVQAHVESKLLVYFNFIESLMPIPKSRLGK
jgi:hypothetical protein